MAWKHGNLHLSAPCIYSEVMESLKLEPGMSFLNLGSGTGYLSTMVGLMLGPYGVNHGVEYHADVVEYAYKKLEQFKQHSPALYKFSFCEPQFVVGNCLCLDQTDGHRLYDRIYCGAAVPPEYERYMQSFLKVGGILVMPLNDQLLQITRRERDKFDRNYVLPVSFASLIEPRPDAATVTLPEVEPLSLKHLTAIAIRSLLRQNVGELEQDQSRARRRERARKYHRRVQRAKARKIVAAIVEEPSDVSSAASSENEAEIELEIEDHNSQVARPLRALQDTVSQATSVLQRVFSAQHSALSIISAAVGESSSSASSPEAELPDHSPGSSRQGQERRESGSSVASSSGFEASASEAAPTDTASDTEPRGRGKRAISVTGEFIKRREVS